MEIQRRVARSTSVSINCPSSGIYYDAVFKLTNLRIAFDGFVAINLERPLGGPLPLYYIIDIDLYHDI